MTYILPNGKFSAHNPNVPDIYGPPARAFTAFGQQSFDRGKLGNPNPIPPPIAFDVRGKVGQTVYQKSIPPPWATWYPRVHSLQRRRHVIPRDPRTLAQLRCRARWAAAQAAWKALSLDEQTSYHDHAERMEQGFTGRELFVKEFCRLHSPNEYATQALLWSAQPELPFIS